METKNTHSDATSPSHQDAQSHSRPSHPDATTPRPQDVQSLHHKIAVVGLGYVGLPLARLFATKYPVVGFDINQNRIAELNNGTDATLEVADEVLQAVLVKENPFTCQPELVEGSHSVTKSQSHHDSSPPHHLFTKSPSLPNSSSPHHPAASSPSHPVTQSPSHPVPNGLYCSSNLEDIKEANIYIVTVPTPVDKHNRPDLTPLYKSSETVGKVLRKGDIVIYESTVYPGVTEEECVPVLERVSGLKFNQDFFAGYSPERINPGDKEHTVEKILKVTSGSTPETGKAVDDLYQSVITAGTHLAPTIKVAEAAKVIENSQRDINIAFVNELAKIFNLLEIDTHAVLEAAGTKWNFLPFKPGLVGGHCIGVDPYYLAQKAQEKGYHPEIILAGRRLNDSMGQYVASEVVKTMIKKGINACTAKVLNLGITFKENCPDVRNTKAVDVVRGLEDYGIHVTTYDPWANPAEVLHEYGIKSYQNINECFSGTEALEVQPFDTITPSPGHSVTQSPHHQFDAIILTVAHKEFLGLDLNQFLKEGGVVYDVKGILENVDSRL